MAHVGMMIENPAAGDSIVFVATREDDSPTLILDMTTIAGASGPPAHRHPVSSERFEVQEGAIVVEADGRSHTLAAGQEFTVAPGVRHKFTSHPEIDGRTRVTLDVPGQMEDFLVTFYELARAGRVDATGLPSLQQIALTGGAIQRDLRPTIAPWIAQRFLFALLGPVARRRGLKPFYTWGELTAAPQ